MLIAPARCVHQFRNDMIYSSSRGNIGGRINDAKMRDKFRRATITGVVVVWGPIRSACKPTQLRERADKRIVAGE